MVEVSACPKFLTHSPKQINWHTDSSRHFTGTKPCIKTSKRTYDKQVLGQSFYLLASLKQDNPGSLLVDCKTVGFFLKIRKEIGKARRKSLPRAKRASVSPQSRSLFSASFQTFYLTARAYLNTQKYGLFCSLFTSTTVHKVYYIVWRVNLSKL